MAREFAPARPHVFDSFWMGGFETATHVNEAGRRLDIMSATEHDVQVDHDYALLRSVGITTVRDGVRWHLIERNGTFDFSSLAPMVVAAERHGIQVLWTLLHYGVPDDVDLFSAEFPARFARFSAEVARFIQSHSKRLPFYTPVNEISFFAWAAGEVGWFAPFGKRRGGELKRQLVKAAIAASDAVWKVDRRARIVHVDPVIHVVPPVMRPDLTRAAAEQRESQFESWDMLAGIQAPELGGHPRYLDVMGVNFYHSNQWEYPNVPASAVHRRDEPRRGRPRRVAARDCRGALERERLGGSIGRRVSLPDHRSDGLERREPLAQQRPVGSRAAGRQARTCAPPGVRPGTSSQPGAARALRLGDGSRRGIRRPCACCRARRASSSCL